MLYTNRKTRNINEIEYDTKIFERFRKRNLNTKYLNYKVYHLLCRSEIYINAYGNICKNKGSTTLGIKEDEGYLQSFGLEKAKKIAQEFKNKHYKWQALRRTMIPKPGTNKMRPIDTPTQRDRIVQEAIRCILEAIFEPEFQELEESNGFMATNYGFRPNKSCIMAVKTLKLKGKPTNIAIEGDIKGAYNNVNREKLLYLISLRVKDKEFLAVLKNLLDTGIMERQKYIHTLTGTPQGGIVSPLLFNIYMFPLDKYISKDIEYRTRENTGKRNRHNLEYTRTLEEMKSLRKKISMLEKGSNERLESLKKLKLIRKESLMIPSIDLKHKNVGAIYARYADDWVYFIQGSKKDAIEMKEKINNFTVKELHLELDPDKTLISKLHKGISFLGFEIIRWNKNQTKITKTIQTKTITTKNGTKTCSIPKYKRASVRGLNILPCKKRILKTLISKKMLDQNKGTAIAIRNLIQFTPFEIVTHFGNIATGMANYYIQCDSHARLNYYFYILQYSCLRTLSARSKKPLAQTIKKYGLQSNINQEFKSSKGSYYKTARVPSLSDLRKEGFMSKNIKINHSDFDPFKFKLNYRTKLKTFVECCRCGSDYRVEMHHLGSVKSIRKTKGGYSKDINQPIRNRLQMPLCKKCHDLVTYGKYDADNLKNYYNSYIASL